MTNSDSHEELRSGDLVGQVNDLASPEYCANLSDRSVGGLWGLSPSLQVEFILKIDIRSKKISIMICNSEIPLKIVL